ncbi:MAG TPA: S41 family peptidase [Fimbriimonas sp.]
MLFGWIATAAALSAQGTVLDRSETVERLAKLMEESYSYPAVGKKMADAVRERNRKGEYRAFGKGEELAQRLTEDLTSVSRDKHVFVRFSADVLPPEPEKLTEPSTEQLEEQRKMLALENFGLKKAEVLAGNVGYLDFRYFAPISLAGDAYHGAMAAIASTDALIIDLRNNTGSMDPETIPTLAGYFFARPVHLGDLQWRWEKQPRQFWSAAEVPGKRYLDKPVYLLTSNKTFSGGEAMAYEFQALKRATLVGERTGGGANPNIIRRIDDHFIASVPSGIAKNAVTGTNWEETGVVPDVPVPAVQALRTAHLALLRKLNAEAKEGWDRHRLSEALRQVEETPDLARKVRFKLSGFEKAAKVTLAGTFNYWSTEATPLRREGNAWVADALVEPGRHAYKFIVDGKWTSDPANPRHEPGEGDTDSVIIVE